MNLQKPCDGRVISCGCTCRNAGRSADASISSRKMTEMKGLTRKAALFTLGGWFVFALSLLLVLMLFQGWLNAVRSPSLFDRIAYGIALFYMAYPLSCILASVLLVRGGRLLRDAGHEYISWLTILLQPSLFLAAHVYQSCEDMRWDIWRYTENCLHAILIGLSGYIPVFLAFRSARHKSRSHPDQDC